MPRYNFKNINTNEEIELEMKIAELDEFKKNHPELQQILNKLSMGDPVKLGVKKPPSEFQRDVIGKIHKNTPGSRIGQTSRWDIN